MLSAEVLPALQMQMAEVEPGPKEATVRLLNTLVVSGQEVCDNIMTLGAVQEMVRALPTNQRRRCFTDCWTTQTMTRTQPSKCSTDAEFIAIRRCINNLSQSALMVRKGDVQHACHAIRIGTVGRASF